jgi:hypothetical protein
VTIPVEIIIKARRFLGKLFFINYLNCTVETATMSNAAFFLCLTTAAAFVSAALS